MTPHRSRNLLIQWLVAAALGALALVLGYRGFGQHPHSAQQPLLSQLYLTLQLFTLSSGARVGTIPWELEVARFLAPVVFGYTVVLALFTSFWSQLAQLRLRLTRNHTIVCGLGRKGLHLTQTLLRDGHQGKKQRVVVIQAEHHREHMAAAHASGALLVPGDATQHDLLRHARLGRASRVIAVTGDDGTNIEIALAVNKLLAEQGRQDDVELCVHVVDPFLASALQHQISIKRVKIIDMYRSAAEDLSRHLAPSPNGMHLLVVGCGQQGEAILCQAAGRASLVIPGRPADEAQIEVTVFDRAATRKKQRLLAKHPWRDAIRRFEFVEGDVLGEDLIEEICRRVERDGERCALVICMDDDTQNLALANLLKSEPRSLACPIYVRVRRTDGVATLHDDGKGICTFGDLDTICSPAALLHAMEP